MLGQSRDGMPKEECLDGRVSYILALLPICCVTLDKPSNLSRSQFLHEKLEKYCCSQRTWRTNGILGAEVLALSQVWSRCYATGATVSLVASKTSSIRTRT